MASANAAEDIQGAGEGLLARVGRGDGGGAGDGTSSPNHLARRGWPMGSMGASGGAG